MSHNIASETGKIHINSLTVHYAYKERPVKSWDYKKNSFMPCTGNEEGCSPLHSDMPLALPRTQNSSCIHKPL